LKRSPAEHKGPPPGLTAAIVKAASLSRIGIAVSFDDAGERRFAYVSEVAARLLGYEPQELVKQPAAHVLGRTSEAASAPQSGSRHGSSAVEAEIFRKDRSTVTVRMASTRATADGREAIVDFLFDTEDRHRAEKLEKSKTRFRTLLDLAPEGVVIAVPERIEYVNPALLRLLGYTSVERMARIPFDEHVHPADLNQVLERMRHLLTTGDSIGPLEIRGRRSDGSYVAIEVVAILAEWDEKPAALAIGRDLDQRRQLKSQSIQADRLTALGTLAAGVAHEINNPLAYVLLNLQYLMREVPKFTGDPGRLAVFLDRLGEARHGTERVSTIVRDLRAFARSDQDTHTAVDLRRVLAAAIRIASAQIDARVRIEEDYEEVPAVNGNAARLEQVFLNLLINATQAFPEKDSAANEIRVRLRGQGERVIAAIEDNGGGIDPGLLSRVFDPFFTTKPGIGTGLGLPICHSIVKRLGGEIDVQSTPGVGTVFRVTLPVQVQTAQERPPAPEPSVAESRRARVLVVDDELPLASMLSRILGDEHDVAIATSAPEALERLRTDPEVDVVLCDLLMPAMSGMDLYRELQNELPGVQERMVFMTGGAFTPRAAEFLASVPNERLEKPFDLNQVRKLVRSLSSQRPLPRAGE
jgi:PAS domain S-box-containing protein